MPAALLDDVGRRAWVINTGKTLFAQIMAEVAELGLEHRRNRTKHSTPGIGEPMDSP